MTCRVLFFSMLRDIVGAEELEWPMHDGITAGEIFDSLSVQFPSLAGWSNALLIAVNQEYARRDTVIPPEAEVAFMPPVQGG